MGTNFYLRRVKPREVHDLMHIAKRSAGWVIHFQDSTDGYAEPHDDAPEPPAFHSVADIRDLLESGDWQLADEYGDVWEPGEESLREFDKLCTHPARTQAVYVNSDDCPYNPCASENARSCPLKWSDS